MPSINQNLTDDNRRHNNAPGETPGALLWRAANAWQRSLRRVLHELGLTQAQFALLDALSARAAASPPGDGANQRQLGTQCGMDVTMVSAVIRQLQRNGLVARRTGSDARSREVTLTPAGRRRVAVAAPKAAAVDVEFFAGLRQDQPAFAGALRLLLGLRPRVRAPSQKGL